MARRKPIHLQKSERVLLTLTPAQLEWWQMAAASDGLEYELQEWIRRTIDAHTRFKQPQSLRAPEWTPDPNEEVDGDDEPAPF